MNAMRVLYVLDEFADRTAGTEGQFLELIAGVRARNTEVSIALLREAPALSHALPDVPMIMLGLNSLRSAGALRAMWKLVCWSRARRSQVAHIFFNDAAIACPIPLRLSGLPVVVSRRDLGFWYTSASLPLLRLNRLAVNIVVANAQAVKQEVMAREHYPERRVITIYNSWRERPLVNDRLDVRRALGIAPAAPLLLVVANLRPLKRVDDAIRILAIVSARVNDVHLCIVGADRPGAGLSELVRLKALAAAQGVAARVLFAGARNDPWPIVQACDIGLLCSESEGLSNALIEYSAAGKPVVCSNAGGNSEVIVDAVTGYVFRTGDVRGAADKVTQLLSDAVLAESMGARGRQRIHAEFAPEQMIARHLALYRALAGLSA